MENKINKEKVTQVTITLSKESLKKLDLKARAVNRNRSNFIQCLILEDLEKGI